MSLGIKLKTTGLVIGFCTLAGLALAHDGATGIVKERMDGMVQLGQAMKQLSSLTKPDTSYEAITLERGITAIMAHSGENLTKLFPEDSNPMVSEASDTIWQNWPQFVALADQLETQAQDMRSIKTKSALASALGEIGKTCKSCHAEFRVKK